MMPYKRPAADKSGIPVYQPGATTYQQLMQLQQPFVPVSCEYPSPSPSSTAVAATTIPHTSTTNANAIINNNLLNNNNLIAVNNNINNNNINNNINSNCNLYSKLSNSNIVVTTAASSILQTSSQMSLLNNRSNLITTPISSNSIATQLTSSSSTAIQIPATNTVAPTTSLSLVSSLPSSLSSPLVSVNHSLPLLTTSASTPLFTNATNASSTNTSLAAAIAAANASVALTHHEPHYTNHHTNHASHIDPIISSQTISLPIATPHIYPSAHLQQAQIGPHTQLYDPAAIAKEVAQKNYATALKLAATSNALAGKPLTALTYSVPYNKTAAATAAMFSQQQQHQQFVAAANAAAISHPTHGQVPGINRYQFAAVQPHSQFLSAATLARHPPPQVLTAQTAAPTQLMRPDQLTLQQYAWANALAGQQYHNQQFLYPHLTASGYQQTLAHTAAANAVSLTPVSSTSFVPNNYPRLQLTPQTQQTVTPGNAVVLNPYKKLKTS